MQTHISTNGGAYIHTRSLWEVTLSEWRWWLAGGCLAFMIASIVMTGWPTGLLPNISYPYSYNGDGLAVSWVIQRLHEGWVFNNTRNGYPFSSAFFDYPSSDAGNYLVLKLLGLPSNNYASTLNLYFLSGFFVNFVAAYCTLRTINICRVLSAAAAVLFDFLPFHFLRLEHLFYTWYFVIPIFFYIAFKILFLPKKEKARNKYSYLFNLTGLVVLASFGVYYALFGIIVIGTAGLAKYIKYTDFRATIPAIIAIAGIALGVAINVLPNVVYKTTHGVNPAAVVRSPGDAERYGLKLIQLLLPTPNHRVKWLSELQDNYDKTAPLVNENATASLGIIGTLGFIILGAAIIFKLSGTNLDKRLAFLGTTVLILFLFGTIGGLGAIFSRLVSSDIRGWNRISIFIGYGSIAAFFLTLQNIVETFKKTTNNKPYWLLAVPITCLGVLDQTPPTCTVCNTTIKRNYSQDQEFIKKIEQSLPRGSAIYQLPYMQFPETPPLYKLTSYGLAIGFLHSKTLRWNYGGMKGRPGDLFYQSLAKESIDTQLKIIYKLGFSGIYIDRRGYKDNADHLIEKLSAILKPSSPIYDDDREVVFFKLPKPQAVDFKGLSDTQIMRSVGYLADQLGPRYSASWSQGIDFTRSGAPYFVRSIDGLSVLEPWGRWSDANISPSVRISFFSPIPERFTLQLLAQPFGQNGEQNVTITIGHQKFNVHLQPGINEIKIPVELSEHNVKSIEFRPHKPISPKELSPTSNDSRKLGIGLIRLQFQQ